MRQTGRLLRVDLASLRASSHRPETSDKLATLNWPEVWTWVCMVVCRYMLALQWAGDPSGGEPCLLPKGSWDWLQMLQYSIRRWTRVICLVLVILHETLLHENIAIHPPGVYKSEFSCFRWADDSGSSFRRKPFKGEMNYVCGDKGLNWAKHWLRGVQASMLEAVTQPLQNKRPALPSFTQAMDHFLH